MADTPGRAGPDDTAGGELWWAIDALAEEAPDGWEYVDLYSLFGRVDQATWALAGRAVQIVAWAQTHRFCGRCGIETEPVPGERATRCGRCGLMSFPRLAPAAIMLVEKGDEMLLAHGVQFPAPFFSALAGFVEPGETLENAVVREVREEVGVEVADVTYRKSQPWPFPHSLMLGFTCRWVAGDIDPDPTEIVDAGWFGVDRLPAVPPRGMSIAGELIGDFVAGRRTVAEQR